MITDIELELEIQAIDLCTISPLNERLVRLGVLYWVLHDGIKVCS